MSPATRRSRRALGKRERRRLVNDKTVTLVRGVHAGYSSQTLAVQLGFSVEKVEELTALVHKADAERQAEGGGG